MKFTHLGKYPATFFIKGGKLLYDPIYEGIDSGEVGILNYLGDTKEDALETIEMLKKINLIFRTTFIVDNFMEAYQFGEGWEEEQASIFKSNKF